MCPRVLGPSQISLICLRLYLAHPALLGCTGSAHVQHLQRCSAAYEVHYLRGQSRQFGPRAYLTSNWCSTCIILESGHLCHWHDSYWELDCPWSGLRTFCTGFRPAPDLRFRFRFRHMPGPNFNRGLGSTPCANWNLRFEPEPQAVLGGGHWLECVAQNGTCSSNLNLKPYWGGGGDLGGDTGSKINLSTSLESAFAMQGDPITKYICYQICTDLHSQQKMSVIHNQTLLVLPTHSPHYYSPSCGVNVIELIHPWSSQSPASLVQLCVHKVLIIMKDLG
jgi:hypothetical protein